MARVSNPENQDNKKTSARLIKYLLDHKHFSPFEMVNACVEINCPRDISHQILRHRSFTFQEFSGRYAVYPELLSYREPRMQDHKNRQSSLPVTDSTVRNLWKHTIENVRDLLIREYNNALDAGIAKEVARILLPEGLVPTKMYMNGTLRSWIHYWAVRCTPETQKEHRLVAEATREVIMPHLPLIAHALSVT